MVSQVKKNSVSFIGASMGLGAQKRGTEDGPSAFRKGDLFPELTKESIYWEWNEISFTEAEKSDLVELAHHHKNHQRILPPMSLFLQRLKKQAALSCSKGHLPVIIGGDHSIAASTWRGVLESSSDANGICKNFALIWLDAHMDAHTFETSESGAIHGMPVASLLGEHSSAIHEDKERPYFSGRQILPEHMFMVGVRSYESGEAAILKKLGVKIYFIEEVRERGFQQIFDEIMNTIKEKNLYYGLSIDLDGVDPHYAPGVGSPAANGLNPVEVGESLNEWVPGDKKLKAIEIVEYNPHLDQSNKTLKTLNTLLKKLLIKNSNINNELVGMR